MLIFDECIKKEQISAWNTLSDKYGKDAVLMFDLETTGLSPRNSFIYIIGINLFLNGEWHILQLFNDDGRSEPEMLRAFTDYCSGKSAIFSFNGDTFDIPFVRTRMDKIKAATGESFTDPFLHKLSVDFLKEIRPFKYTLGLPNVKQKTVEQYLGINRIDQYNGGQLIDVYLSYLSSGNEHGRKLVLQHNRDDMEGMFHLACLRAVSNFCGGGINPLDGGITTLVKGNRLFLSIEFCLDMALPKPLLVTGLGITLSGKDKSGKLEIPILQDTLIGQITKEAAEGFFLPAAGYTGLPLYYRSLDKKTLYIPANNALLGTGERLSAYMVCCIQTLMKQTGKSTLSRP